MTTRHLETHGEDLLVGEAVERAAPRYSVIVPTFERLDVLPEVLHALEAQDEAPPFEIVVVDDGSADGTTEFLDAREFRLPARVLRQENAGPAAARNRGVEAARGEIVAFLGDDTVPAPNWLASHDAARRARPEIDRLAVIGYTGWHRRMRLDPFLRYINEHGLQFGYALIEDPDDLPFNFFYTSNLSLPRACLQAEPFDLGFPYPAWEDIELAYRLTTRRGLRLVYERRAQVEHDHPTDLDRFMIRQEKAGYCAVVFHRRHAELGGFLGLGPAGPPPLLSPRRQRLRVILARVLQSLRVRAPSLWDEILRFHYIRGLHRGWRDREAGRFETMKKETS
ncbi:MAG: glycosyltransferase family 2 protein [Acidobacteriota bacterium]